ncbi:hypothetical protein [Falsihalocynthiibacter sp. S25ZX9]|uniref:hypothetical protein n=1 Tax=Falsihalocynthiibacter sp. S25ZX9 TaxID=3240870 RepID=UPI00350F7FCB
MRAVLYEFGHAFPKGIGNIKRIDAILEEPNCDLPSLVRDKCKGLVKQIAEQTIRNDAKTRAAKEMAATADTAPSFSNHRGNVTIELDGVQDDPRGIGAGTNAGKEAAYAGGDCVGQQDCARDLGHADQG